MSSYRQTFDSGKETTTIRLRRQSKMGKPTSGFTNVDKTSYRITNYCVKDRFWIMFHIYYSGSAKCDIEDRF